MIRSIAFAIAFALTATAIASAQTPEEQAACQDDALRFCQNAIPDHDRVFHCLIANKDAISAACHIVLARFLPAEPGKKRMAAPRNKKGPVDLSPTVRR